MPLIPKNTGPYYTTQSQELTPPTKKYVALLNQTGTNPPTATVLQNTFGATLVWTRTDVGDYFLTLTGAFTSLKTIGFISGVNGGSASIVRLNGNQMELQVFDATPAFSDGYLQDTGIEITVYQ